MTLCIFAASVRPPPLKIERVQDASPLSASRLAFSSVSGHKTRRPYSPRGSDRSLSRNLWSGLLAVLLCLPLFLGFATEEAQAQTATLSISAPTDANEGNSGTRDLVFPVSLTAGVTDTTTFTVCFTGTATIHTPSAVDYLPPYPAIPAGSDYQALQGTGSNLAVWNQNCVDSSINSNQTGTGSTQTIGIRVKGDTDAESDETVIATLSLRGTNLSVTLGTSTATHTILDDDTPAPEISVSLPISEGESRSDDGEKKVSESEGGVGIGFPLSADQPLPSALTVCVRVTESGTIDRVTSTNEGIQTVNMPSSLTNGSGNHQLTWTNTAADDPDSSVTVEVVAPSTVGCSAANGSYTVSSSDGSEKLLIQDDEDTTVSLTSTDMTMTEGDASDTAVLTVSLDRRLHAGETIGVPIALTTSTGARLPGSVDGSNVANHDFTVAAAAASMHSGVTLASALTANPRVVFTGHDTNTVQTATVTLTPVANRDDGDAAHETITATLSSLGLLDTTVSGGVTAHASDNAATLTLEDDEAVPAGTPGITLSTSGPLRLLETGSTTYTVVLDAVPTVDVRVNIGRIAGGLSNGDNRAVDTDSYQLTFTTSNWSEAQTVRVTGSDEAGTHRNRALWLNHSVSSSDTRYSGLSNINLRVDVDDAPEVEAYWDFKGRLGPHPSTLNLAGEGNPEATQNAAPFTIMSYAVRLSNRPEPGGTVTVTATVPSDKRHLIGLSLNGSYPWRSSVNVEFKDRDAGAGTGCSNWHGLRKNEYFDSSGNKQTVTGGSNSETWDNSADTPWECWRRIHVIRYSASRNIANTCVDITHTATGGGVRRVAIDTVRAHIINSGSGRKCGWLIGNTPSPQGSPAQAAPAPTEKISNLQVTEVDAASAKVTWDAVANATSYDVSWSAESSDSLNASAGALPGVTGTSATIEHDASVPMTLTVTVTPEYIDENGVTKQLDALAGTATLAIGPSGQRLDSGGGTNDGNGGSIDSGDGAVDLPVPVSHWRFEYDAVDWVGSSHGTESGGVAFEVNEEGEGVEDHALSLDGSDDYVDLSTHVSDFPLGDSTRSVTGWFKADAGNQGQSFFSYGPNVAGKRFSIAADRTQVLVAVSGHAWGVNGLELKECW